VYHTTNLFYKAVHSIINQVLNNIWIIIRKGQLKGKNIKERDVNSNPNLDRILKLDIGYMNLKAIRTSPHYQRHTCKKIYAMIRQLGPPTFFIYFNSAKNRWEPLVNGLK
jgi:hypothetical protein